MTVQIGQQATGMVQLWLGPVTTTDDTPTALQWGRLSADGDCIFVRCRAWGIRDDAVEGFYRLSEGHVARAAGVTYVQRGASVGPNGFSDAPPPLTGGIPAGWSCDDIEIDGDDVSLGIIGPATDTVTWWALYELFLLGSAEVVYA